MGSKAAHRSRKCADLLQAVRLGNYEMALESVRCDLVNVDTPIGGTTPLSLAVSLGHQRLVELLIRHGADVDKMSRAECDRWEPPLFTACRLGRECSVRSLLNASAAVDKTDFYHHTPLWVATKERRPDLVRLLLDNGARTNAERPWSECPLYLATKYGKYGGRRGIAEMLVRGGARTNAADPSGRTPLYWTLANRDREFVRMLVECGARINPVPWSVLEARLVDSLKEDEVLYAWIKTELNAPSSLQRLCRDSIRMCLVSIHGGSILERPIRLPLPAFLIDRIALRNF